MSFNFIGDRRMAAKLRRLSAKSSDLMLTGLALEAELVMTDSKKNYVPVDLGALRASGIVDKAVRRGKNLSVRLSYGGAAAAYALAVHEHLSRHSPPTWHGKPVRFGPSGGKGRGPKYLERPMRRAVRGLTARVARNVKQGFRG